MDFGSFKEMLLTTLQATAETTYSSELLFHSTGLAMQAILPWCANPLVDTLISDGSNTLDLPTGVYRVEAIEDLAENVILPKLLLTPGPRPSPEMPMAAGGRRVAPATWIEYPKGKIRLSLRPEAGHEFLLYYLGSFGQPDNADDDDFIFETPDSVLNGILYYAASHAIVPSAIGSAQIRQFNTKIDSGKPVDNVLEQASRYMRVLFLEEMNRQPKYVGAVQ
jgi:hypothetical protein